MKRWQKSGLLLLTLSLAMGWAAQGEAVLIRIGAPRVVVTHAQPITVIIVDSNGNTFEQTAYYDPSVGGIDIDTSWAGPNASIYIPTLGVSYIWYNGYWVDEEGYYWDGTHRVYVSDPRWRERWTTYWHQHRHDRRDDRRDRREEWRERAKDWRDRRDEWRDERRQDWRDQRDEWRERAQDWRDRRENRHQSGRDRQESFDRSGSWDRQAGAVRSGSFEDGRADSMHSVGSPSRRTDGTMRSAGSPGGQAGGKTSDSPRGGR